MEPWEESGEALLLQRLQPMQDELVRPLHPQIKGNGVSSPLPQKKNRLRRASKWRFSKGAALRARQTPTPHGRTYATPPTWRA